MFFAVAVAGRRHHAGHREDAVRCHGIAGSVNAGRRVRTDALRLRRRPERVDGRPVQHLAPVREPAEDDLPGRRAIRADQRDGVGQLDFERGAVGNSIKSSADCWSTYYELDGDGRVDYRATSAVPGAPAYNIHFVVRAH